MNIEEIQAELSEMIKALMAKGIVAPRAELDIRANEGFSVHIQTTIDTKSLGGKWMQSFYGSAPRALLDEANAFIAALPDPETLVLRTYLGKLADAVDYGHENGIAAEYVDPVRITQKAMSDNLLTADAKAVA